MSKFVFHIGLPKTASSFFQDGIFPRLEGLTYVGPVRIRSNPAFNNLQLADDSLYSPERIQRQLESYSGDRVLVSDERLAGRFLGFGGAINRSIIANRLHALVPDAKILLFLRGQPSWVLSTYQQYIKGYAHGTRPFSKFIREPARYLDPEKEAPLYDDISLGLTLHYVFYYELLRLYTSLFKEVKIILFEDFKKDPAKILLEVEQFVGSSNSLAGEIESMKKQNTAIRGSSLHAVRYFNATRYMGNRVLTKLFRELMLTLNHRLRKPKEDEKAAVRELAGAFHDNNRLVIEHFPEVGIQRYPDEYPTGDCR